MVQIHAPPPNQLKSRHSTSAGILTLKPSIKPMDTKLKGDIAEQAAILQALKRGWGVLRPVGDRLPYDLVFDVGSGLVKVQVKSAWLDESSGNYVVDNRRTKTNRRQILREVYQVSDFDMALAYVESLDLFYVFPASVFISYGSEIHLVEAEKRQRKPRSAQYRDRWDLITPIPSQASANQVQKLGLS
jgi:PD-(D/E)XK endonuclease